MRANSVHLGGGNYEITCAGFKLKSRYCVNRMAKLLYMAGHTGTTEVYRGDRLSLTVDIAKFSRKRMSEADDGFRWLNWDERTLQELARKANIAWPQAA